MSSAASLPTSYLDHYLNYSTSAVRVNVSVLGYRWPGWEWIET